MFALTGACSPPFPKELLEKADRVTPFTELQRDPERYRGRLFLLGGVIVETRNLPSGTQLEILQRPLDGRGRPKETDASGGRFLVITPRFLDAAVFQRGRMVTVIGSIAGQRGLPLGEIEYRYPLIEASAVHLWAPSSGPHFSIGIGVYRGL